MHVGQVVLGNQCRYAQLHFGAAIHRLIAERLIRDIPTLLAGTVVYGDRAVLEHGARTLPTGDVEVTDGRSTWLVGTPTLDDSLSAAMGAAVEVRRETAVSHQDSGQVSLVGSATLDWFAREWGIDADARRLRVNLVVETDQPFVEERWVAHRLAIGSAVLTVDAKVPRCRMIDLAQDGATAEQRWLTRLTQERDMCAAVYLEVTAPGTITVGDSVALEHP